MNAVELKELLERHAVVLAGRGIDVEPLRIDPPATDAEVDEVECQLGFALPLSFRAVLTTLSRSVSWSWRSSEDFAPPFRGIFSGELSWSVDALPELQVGLRGWIRACFPDLADPYHEVWHRKLALAALKNGDFLAVDLGPEHPGEIVYLSHDDGDGHGYVLAESLCDLVDRWAPLACPGPEDWQWLGFVPWDERLIDPACPYAKAWMTHLGLPTDGVRNASPPPTDRHIDALMTAYRNDPTSNAGVRSGVRAVKCCSISRVEDVVAMLASTTSAIQRAAAVRLRDWKYGPAARPLGVLALSGEHNGRAAALRALAHLEGPDAVTVRDELRSVLDPGRLELLECWMRHVSPGSPR